MLNVTEVHEEIHTENLLVVGVDVSKDKLDLYAEHTEPTEDKRYELDDQIRNQTVPIEEVLGWTAEDMEQHSNPRKAFYPDSEQRARARSVVEEAADGWHEFRPRTKDGEPLDTIWTVVLLSDGRSLGIGLDVTDQRKRERQLEETKKEAEEAARLKSSMLANVSHEIRTPLTAITGFAEMLQDRLNEQLGEFAERIHRSGQRLMGTLKSVLQLSRLEAGTVELDREPVSSGRWPSRPPTCFGGRPARTDWSSGWRSTILFREPGTKQP